MQALKKFFCFLSPRARVPHIKKQKKHEKTEKDDMGISSGGFRLIFYALLCTRPAWSAHISGQ